MSSQPRLLASPVARRLASEAGIDLAQIKGSGPNGRIVKADVEAALGTGAPVPAHAPPAPQPEPAPPAAPISPMRKTIANRMTNAVETVPHIYLRKDVRLDRLVDLRAQLAGGPRPIRLTINDFILRACALGLQDVPQCKVIWADGTIQQVDGADIAVAVAVEGGVLVPVIAGADGKSLTELSQDMARRAEQARGGHLPAHASTGGSFALSNLGMYGVDSFDPIVTPPHSVILGVGAARSEPVVAASGALEVATVATLTLGLDHRVLDGADGAALLAAIARYLESPATLLT